MRFLADENFPGDAVTALRAVGQAWRSSLPTGCGIVLFRMPISAQSKTIALLTDILIGRTDWAGYFAVVEPGRIRMRQLPFVPWCPVPHLSCNDLRVRTSVGRQGWHSPRLLIGNDLFGNFFIEQILKHPVGPPGLCRSERTLPLLN
jgi:hypothetical protein